MSDFGGAFSARGGGWVDRQVRYKDAIETCKTLKEKLRANKLEGDISRC